MTEAPVPFETENIPARGDLRKRSFLTPTKIGRTGSAIASKTAEAYDLNNIKVAVGKREYIRIAVPRVNRKTGKRAAKEVGRTKIRSADKGMREFNYTYIPSVPESFYFEIIRALLGESVGERFNPIDRLTREEASRLFIDGLKGQGHIDRDDRLTPEFNAFVESFNNDNVIQLRIAGMWSPQYVKGALSRLGLGLLPIHLNPRVDDWILAQLRQRYGYFDDSEEAMGAIWMKANLPQNYERYLRELEESVAESELRLDPGDVSIMDIIIAASSLRKKDKTTRQSIVYMVDRDGDRLQINRGKVVITANQLFNDVAKLLDGMEKNPRYLKAVAVTDAGTAQVENVGRVNITGLATGAKVSAITLAGTTRVKKETATSEENILGRQKIGLPEHVISSKGDTRDVGKDKVVVNVWSRSKDVEGETSMVDGDFGDIEKYMEIVLPRDKARVLDAARYAWQRTMAVGKESTRAKTGITSTVNVSTEAYLRTGL